jgi:hypothetical protein
LDRLVGNDKAPRGTIVWSRRGFTSSIAHRGDFIPASFRPYNRREFTMFFIWLTNRRQYV